MPASTWRAIALILAFAAAPAAAADGAPWRVLIVSSYHREYLWSQDTSAGVNAGLLEVGWLSGEDAARRLLTEDRAESAVAVVRKLWMDTKRANDRADLAEAVARVLDEAERFRPDVILLGDDNAANYIGGTYLDTRIPVVFWGVNGNPAKYGLIDSMQRPGHNVTGVYQAGYLKEGVQRVQQVLPGVRRLAVLSDASPTGRAKVKELEDLVRRGEIQVSLAGSVVTDSYAAWKDGALALAPNADAFFVFNHNTLEDTDGRPVPQLEAGAWYLAHVRKPDIGHERQFVVEGILCAVDDSGFRQGYEAVRVAHRILDGGEDPAAIAVYAPPPGDFVVNIARARMLGLTDAFEASGLVEERVPRMLALPAD